MMLIREFCTAMENKDWVAIGKCFANASHVYDYCPSLTGKDNSYIFGPHAIEMFYHNRFILQGLKIMDVCIINETSANFYISYGGPIVHVIAYIDGFDKKSGLISGLVIRPA